MRCACILQKGHIQTVNNFMESCMTKADEVNAQSIAFPALGTGNLGYSSSDVARSMFAAVESYARRHPNTLINLVTFVIFETDVRVLMVRL